jgi:cobalt-zinc-cadmium efflux system membrane fusion protein
MKALWLLILPFLVFSQTVKLNKEVEQKLGIKLYTVRTTQVKQQLRLPSVVGEYSNLVAQVFPPVSGIVKKLFVKEGDKVKKGSPLALVYSPHIADLQAQIRMSEVKLKTAKETLSREEMLYKEEVIPYARYYSAKIEYERAKGEYQALLASLRSFGDVVGDALLIKSPIGGYVVEQKVFLGSGVEPSKEMFKIHSHEKLWVYAYALPEDALKVRKGMRGYTIWQNYKAEGTVDYVSHEVDQNTKRVLIRLLVNNVKDLFKPGLMTETVIQTGSTWGVWIPLQAVQRVKDKDVVFVRVDGGFEIRTIRKLMQDGNNVLVEGLKDGEKIATSGLIFLKSQAENE